MSEKSLGKAAKQMVVTATEFKTNMGKYLSLVSTNVIYITKNGKEIAKLTKPDDNRLEVLDSLVGILPQDAASDQKQVKKERLERQ